MTKQYEITDGGLSKFRQVKCECIKGGVVVYLQVSFDPKFWIGKCGRCGKPFAIKESDL